MKEPARVERNKQRLGECFPVFAKRVANVIKDMETLGFRPRIQDAHRTIEDQLKAFNNGFSDVKFGFHNVTGATGKPESLAVDLLDDDHPLAPPRKYVITLASVAQNQNRIRSDTSRTDRVDDRSSKGWRSPVLMRRVTAARS